MMSPNNRVIYIGVTNDLIKRVYQHRNKLTEGFTKKYNVCKLVYWEEFLDVRDAIEREKRIKAGSRQKKLDLIIKNNPRFIDLYDSMIE